MKQIACLIAGILLGWVLSSVAAQQTISSGTGVYWDDEKDKINSNFTELYNELSGLTAADVGAVALTGNETVAGVKTFSSFPVTPSAAPTTDYQVSNKKYVDDNIASGSQTPWGSDIDTANYELTNTTGTGSVVIELNSSDGSDYFEVEDSGDGTLFSVGSSGAVVVNGSDVTIDRRGDAVYGRMVIDVDSSYWGGINFQTGGVNRMAFGKSTDAESTGDVGSDFIISRYNDAGTYQGIPFRVRRSTGTTEITKDLVMTEQADHTTASPAAGYGYLWTKSTTPSTLIFTDDEGTDTTLGSGGGTFSGTYLEFTEQTSDPGDPGTGKAWLYVDDSSPSTLMYEDDTGGDHVVMTGVHTDTSPTLGGNLAVNSFELTSDGDMVLKLGDNAGSFKFYIHDSDGNCVWGVDSNGNTGAGECP